MAPTADSLRLLLLDNYDSFTWNLWDLLHGAARTIGVELTVEVVAHDAATVADLLSQKWDGLVLSPGPKAPQDAGILLELIQAAWGQVPIWGVCLGHQALVAAQGGNIVRAATATHGKVSGLHHTGWGPLAAMGPSPTAMRYHSLCAVEPLPATLQAVAWLNDGSELIMAVAGRTAPVFGVQFHPESCATPAGLRLAAAVLVWMAGERAVASKRLA